MPALAYSGDMKNAAAVELGRLGGRVKGPCKARTSGQARAAVNVRWAKYRLAKQAAAGKRQGK